MTTSIKSLDTQTQKAYFKHTEKNAKAGQIQDQYCIALCYTEGFGVKQNYARAIEWFEKAAQGGHEKSQKIMALYLETIKQDSN